MKSVDVPWAVRFSVAVGATALVLLLAYFGVEMIRGNVDLSQSTQRLDRYVSAVMDGDARTAEQHLCQRIRDETDGSEGAFEELREATLSDFPDGVDEVVRLHQSASVATIRLRLGDGRQEVRYLYVIEESDQLLFCPGTSDALLGTVRRPSR